MPRLIAFLRAINVGRGRVVKMDFLRHLFESLGFSAVETFIASGNVVFDPRAKNAKTLERKIEQRLRKALGYDVAVFIRTSAELMEIGSFEPLRPSQIQGVGAGVNIIFLADALDERSKQKVLALKTDTDEFRIRGREVYWLRRRKPDQSMFSTVRLEKALSRPFTIRGANTIRKLAAKST
jgi:uncharacterized protein (DUF1697 family)